MQYMKDLKKIVMASDKRYKELRILWIKYIFIL